MSDYNAKRSFPARVKHALFENKLKLAMPVKDSKKKATLSVGTFMNNPGLTVYTNVEGDANKGTIRANLDTYTFMAIAGALGEVIDSKPDAEGNYQTGFRIPAKRKKPGGNWDDLVVESWVHIGRDTDGRVYIAVTGVPSTSPVATSIKFIFGPSDFHNDWQFNGKPIDGVKLSEIYANAWGRTLTEMVTSVLVNNYDEPTPPPDSGNKSNWKPAAQSSNSTTTSVGDFDDVFPF